MVQNSLYRKANKCLLLLLLHSPCVYRYLSQCTHYHCDKVCGSNYCNQSFIEAFLKEVIQLYAMGFGYFVLFQPTLLRFQIFEAMHSTMLTMGSVGYKKVTSATRVWSRLFDSCYSTLFYRVSDIKSFLTPLRCVYVNLKQCTPLYLQRGLKTSTCLKVQ